MKLKTALPFFLLVPFCLWLALMVVPTLPVEMNYYLKRSGINLLSKNRPQWVDKEEPRLQIPKIFLDEKITFDVDSSDENVYQKALGEGVAQAAGTGLPGSGKLGYYFAHSSEPVFFSGRKPPFLLLDKMAPGDMVYVLNGKKKFSYVVTSSVIVEPTDLSFLDKNYDEETIVLQGCWPPMTAWKRRLVFAKKLPNGLSSKLNSAISE